MRTRHYKNDPKKLLEQGKEIIKRSSDDNKFVHRVSMVNLVLSGMTPRELSKYCSDSPRALYDWVAKVDESGWESLKTVKQKGRTPRLSEQQVVDIKSTVSDDPEKYGFHTWSGPSLSEHIRKTYKIELGDRACQKLMHKMGFALIRPQTYPSLEKPDNEAREEFKKNCDH